MKWRRFAAMLTLLVGCAAREAVPVREVTVPGGTASGPAMSTLVCDARCAQIEDESRDAARAEVSFFDKLREAVNDAFTRAEAADPLPIPAPTDGPDRVMLELTLSKEMGAVVRARTLYRSRSKDFDAAVLRRLEGLPPVGAAPQRLVSENGLVRLWWECHREAADVCSVRHVGQIVRP
jgi:hypothetical protein